MPSVAWVFLVLAAVLVVGAVGLRVKSVGKIELHDHQVSSPFAALLVATVLGALGLFLPLDHGGKALWPVFVSDGRGDDATSASANAGTSANAAAASNTSVVPTVPSIVPSDPFDKSDEIRIPRFDLDAVVSPTSGRSGDSVTVTGSGCDPGEKVEVNGIGPNLLAVVRADSAGAFHATFEVPEWPMKGLRQIDFRCMSSGSSGSGEFTLS